MFSTFFEVLFNYTITEAFEIFYSTNIFLFVTFYSLFLIVGFVFIELGLKHQKVLKNIDRDNKPAAKNKRMKATICYAMGFAITLLPTIDIVKIVLFT